MPKAGKEKVEKAEPKAKIVKAKAPAKEKKEKVRKGRTPTCASESTGVHTLLGQITSDRENWLRRYALFLPASVQDC